MSKNINVSVFLFFLCISNILLSSAEEINELINYGPSYWESVMQGSINKQIINKLGKSPTVFVHEALVKMGKYDKDAPFRPLTIGIIEKQEWRIIEVLLFEDTVKSGGKEEELLPGALYRPVGVYERLRDDINVQEWKFELDKEFNFTKLVHNIEPPAIQGIDKEKVKNFIVVSYLTKLIKKDLTERIRAYIAQYPDVAICGGSAFLPYDQKPALIDITLGSQQDLFIQTIFYAIIQFLSKQSHDDALRPREAKYCRISMMNVRSEWETVYQNILTKFISHLNNKNQLQDYKDYFISYADSCFRYLNTIKTESVEGGGDELHYKNLNYTKDFLKEVLQLQPDEVPKSFRHVNVWMTTTKKRLFLSAILLSTLGYSYFRGKHLLPESLLRHPKVAWLESYLPTISFYSTLIASALFLQSLRRRYGETIYRWYVRKYWGP